VSSGLVPGRFVVGFPVDPVRREVALIHKLRPEWQRGKLNGMGGRIELGESPVGAMRREAAEEAGLTDVQWLQFHYERHANGPQLWFYVAAVDSLRERVRTLTDERVVVVPLPIFSVDFLRNPDVYVYNLCFLVPMATTYLAHEDRRYLEG